MSSIRTPVAFRPNASRVWTLRQATLLIWIAILALTPYRAYADLPPGFAAGWGLGRIWLEEPAIRSALLNPVALATLPVATIVGMLALVVWCGRLWWLLPGTCVAVLILDSLTKSLGGYTNHAQTAPLLVLLILSVHPRSGTRSAGPAWRCDDAAVLWLARLALILPYTFIGVHRLWTGGFELLTSDAILDYVKLSSSRYSNFGFSIFLPLVERPWVGVALKAGFVVTTALEATSAAAMRWAKFRMVWLAVMVSFHLMTMVTMNIFFWENLILLLVLFGPWPRETGFVPDSQVHPALSRAD